MATYLQSDRRLVIRTPLPEHTLLLAGFSGVEAMSEPFMFHLDLGHKGLALSTTICATLDFIVLYFLMRPAAGTLDTKKLLSTLLRCGLACLAIAAVCYAGKNFLPILLPQSNLLNRGVVVLGTIGLAASAYLGACLLLRVEETRSALDIIQRKLKKQRTP
jgi:putative peptidoglycan lipid II flippase